MKMGADVMRVFKEAMRHKIHIPIEVLVNFMRFAGGHPISVLPGQNEQGRSGWRLDSQR